MVRFADRLRCSATGGGIVESIGSSTSLALVTAATATLTVERTNKSQTVLDLSVIAQKLQLLRDLDSELELFGAETHRYELNRVLSEAEVQRFEQNHAIELPSDFQLFLTQVGNGGAGPHYGVFALGEIHGQDFALPNLSKPFKHDEAWNMSREWFSNLPDPFEGVEFPAERPRTIRAHIELLKTLPKNAAAQKERSEKRGWYFSTEHIQGALPICHEGCGYLNLLVVSGPERGNVWIDGRCSDHGLAPLSSATSARLSFAEWYLRWLDDCLTECEPRPS